MAPGTGICRVRPEETPVMTAACTPQLRGRRVLVVDDDHDSADCLAQYLQAALQCEVDTAYDGAQAVAKAMERRPEVMILDIEMPVLDGIEAAWSVKNAYPDSPPFLVALTGNSHALHRRRQDGRTFDCTFIKPIDYEQFADALREGVTGQR
jgi:CheY-like chemotaxis protein